MNIVRVRHATRASQESSYHHSEMNSFKRIEPIATAVLTVCAMILTVGYVRREFFSPNPGAPKPPEVIADWQAFETGNMRFGKAGATLSIVAFSDFECPACRKLHRTVQALRARDSGAVHVTYRNYPLIDLHPSARDAAIAAQCAADQGAFERVHDYLFEHQATLASMDWVRVATELGVSDSVKYRTCLSAPATLAKLSDDSTAADSLQIDGTPLVLVNGLLFRGAPKPSVLDSLAKAIGRKPE